MEQDHITQSLKDRFAAIATWLEDTAPYAQADQRHLAEHSPEQAYWHLGYATALADVLAMIRTAAKG